MKSRIRRPRSQNDRRTLRLELLRLEDRTVPAGWQALSALPASPTGAASYIHPDHYRPIGIDVAEFRSELAAAPAEASVWSGQAAGLVFTLPRPDGTIASFAVVDSPIMAPELAAQFPEIKTYAGQGLDDPSATIRMDITPQGFHAQVLSGTTGKWNIDPYYHLEDQFYISYFSHDLPANSNRPNVLSDVLDSGSSAPSAETAGKGPGGSGSGGDGSGGFGARSGTKLRTYRLAVAGDGEYTVFHGGTVALGQAAIVTAINRLDGVYENELAVRMVLVANNSSLVYTDPATDPYTNNNVNKLLTENQANIDSVIGDANYDLGHVFTTGAGGASFLGIVGTSGKKAQAATGIPTPIGDDFVIDYVAHEFGHTFNANHSFNTPNTGQSNAATAYEPGSGSTIMSYAGITGADSDLQPHSDPYFHSINFDEIIGFVDNVIPSVGSRTSTGNSVPTVNAGLDHTIPTGTPFALTATGSDANGDSLTYSWEERDLGPNTLLSAADNGSSPIFRVFSPTTNPTRTFPQLSDVIGNTATPGEKLYAQARTSNFRVTVRDNRSGGGGVNTDDMVLTVVNTGTPFVVTAPNAATTWNGNSGQTVTWNVAGTTGNGINAANVRIKLSIDGGLTYPITVLASTPNDGTQAITAPNFDTTKARIRVEAVGNVFFDISDANFTIVGIPGITVSPTSGLVTTEAGGKATFTVVLDTKPTANVTISLSSSNTAEGTVAPSSLVFTTSNWASPQTVTVTGVDDPFVDPDVVYTIVTGAAVSSDSKYSGLNPADVSVTNLNDDFAGFTITPSSGLVTTEVGAKATFTVSLFTKPTASVTISLTSSNIGEGTVSPSTLTFTTTNWASPQTVTVTGVDDTAVDGDVAYAIVTGAATSLDVSYSGLNPPDVSLTNTNDDTNLTLAAVGATHRYRQSLTMTATIGGLNGHPTSGMVDFTFGAIDLGAFPVINGVATLVTTALPIGTDTINAVYAGDSFYHPSSGTANVLIDRALVGVIASSKFKLYGAAVPLLTYTATGLVDGDSTGVLTGSLATTATASSSVAPYTINQGTLDGGLKYEIAFTPGVLSVTPATLTIAATTQTKIFGQALAVLPYLSSGFVNLDTASILSGLLATTATAASPVGAYPISLGTVGAGINYTIAFLPSLLTVTPATVTISADPKSKVYGPDAIPALTFTTAGFVSPDTGAILSGGLDTSAAVGSGVGQYPISLGTLLANDNYTLSLVPAVVTITPAPLTVTATSLSLRTGARIPTLPYTVSGLVNGDAASVLSGLVVATPANRDSIAGTYPIAPTGGSAANYALIRQNGTITLTLSIPLVGANRFAIGSDTGGSDVVTAYNAAGAAIYQATPFPGFKGGVRVASGDVNGDGIADLAVGTGPGEAAQVMVLDGATGEVLFVVSPFDDFTGGVFVVLGDMNNDGKADLVVTPDLGGGPRVIIYRGGDFSPIQNFFGILDPDFRGGARAALGDINGDGFSDLVISAGNGGGPRISLIDGKSLSQGQYLFLTSDFFAFSDVLRNGTYVAVGDVDGDGYGDLIFGAGPGGSPRVLILSGRTLIEKGSIVANRTPIANFFYGDENSRNGAWVSAKNLNDDAYSEVLLGEGSQAVVLSGHSLAQGQVQPQYIYSADTGPSGGVFVG